MLRELVGLKYLRLTYFAFLRSHISYSLLMWGHSAAVNNILLTQNKFWEQSEELIYGITAELFFKKIKIFKNVFQISLFILIYSYTKLIPHLFLTRHEWHSHFTRNRTKLHIIYYNIDWQKLERLIRWHFELFSINYMTLSKLPHLVSSNQIDNTSVMTWLFIIHFIISVSFWTIHNLCDNLGLLCLQTVCNFVCKFQPWKVLRPGGWNNDTKLTRE